MVKGLRTPYKDEDGLALLQLTGRLLQLNRSSKTIMTCYAHTMLNLNWLGVSTGVVPCKQVSTRVGLLPMVASRDFVSFVEDLQ